MQNKQEWWFSKLSPSSSSLPKLGGNLEMSFSFLLYTSLSFLNYSVCIMFCVHVLPPQFEVAVAGVTAVIKLNQTQH